MRAPIPVDDVTFSDTRDLSPKSTLGLSSTLLSILRDDGLHRIDDGVVAGAAAHVARDEVADLRARHCPAAPHQFVGRQQHAGRAEAALRGVARDELALQLRDLAAIGQPLDGIHGLAGNLRRQREAAARDAAVDHHGACAADPVLAAEMGSGQLQLLAQEVGEVLARLDPPLQRLAVQSRFDRDVSLSEEVGHGVALCDSELNTRRVSTVAIWSLVSARRPAVSSGARSCRIACAKADISASGIESPLTAAETAGASLARSTQPK